ncbi:MAG: GspH/FimT family pseudopilin [Burkholderiales bacterium]
MVITRLLNDGFPRSACRGFTLIEALLVIVILAILAAVGVPNLSTFILSQRLKSASFDIFSTLVYARSEAITRNGTVNITPVGGNWSGGWTVTEAASGATLRSQGALNGISMTGPASVSYAGMGRLNAAVTAFSLTATGVNDANSRCVSIDLSGRPVTKQGACP